MVIGAHTVFSCAINFLNGRKCVFCGSFKTIKAARIYVKCMLCGKQKSLYKLRREIAILQGFYQQQPAYRLASDLGLHAKTITRVYQRLRLVLFHTAELEEAPSSRVRLRWMSPTLGVQGRGNEALVLEAKASFWPVGAGRQGLYQDSGVGLGADPHDPYREPYPQGLGLLYGRLSRPSVFAALW
jgi:hypothetical protein